MLTPRLTVLLLPRDSFWHYRDYISTCVAVAMVNICVESTVKVVKGASRD